MTRADVSGYQAIERRPTRIGYRGLDVWGMGPPSSGGSTVGEALNILEGYSDLAADRVRALHLMLEASRFTFADRNAYLADPDFFDVPLAGLLSDSFAAERRALIDETHAATSPVAAGDPYDNQKQRRQAPARAAATISHPRQSTTHLVVSDSRGNVVSYTFTIESTGGNAIVVPGYGFLMNNELTDFNFDSQTHPNRSDGDKRPRSSMSPTIVTRDGRPFIAVGSPGGSTIPGTVLQILLGRLDLGDTLPQAIARPRATQRNAHDRHGGAGLHQLARGPGARRLRPHLHLDGRDRRGHRHRVPRRRQDAGRGRAGAPRRRQRGGRRSHSIRRVRGARLPHRLPRDRSRVADYVIRPASPRWHAIGLFDHPAHLATATCSAARDPVFLAGSLLPDLDHIPLGPSGPPARRPAAEDALDARGRSPPRPSRSKLAAGMLAHFVRDLALQPGVPLLGPHQAPLPDSLRRLCGASLGHGL